jgi:hypothetical protein
VQALIKLTQDANVGGDGQALFGDLADDVVIENVVNTGIGSWEIQVLEVPFGSSVTKGVLAQANGSTPIGTLSPDVAGGMWRLMLTVWPQANKQGVSNRDIRCFGVLGSNGLCAPPPQIWPEPLPDPRTGRSGAKPNECNFGGDTASDGYAGSGSDGLLRHAVRLIGAGGGSGTVVASYFNDAVDGDANLVNVVIYTVPSGEEGWYQIGAVVQPTTYSDSDYYLFVDLRTGASNPIPNFTQPAYFYRNFAGAESQAPYLAEQADAPGAGARNVYLYQGDKLRLSTFFPAASIVLIAARVTRIALRTELE